MRFSVQQIVALADEEVRRIMRGVGAEVQASLALNRAVLQALAAMSQQAGAVIEQVLEAEADDARRLAAPQRAVDLIEDARARLYDVPADDPRMAALERALQAAAEDTPEPEAESAVRAFRAAGG